MAKTKCHNACPISWNSHHLWLSWYLSHMYIFKTSIDPRYIRCRNDFSYPLNVIILYWPLHLCRTKEKFRPAHLMVHVQQVISPQATSELIRYSCTCNTKRRLGASGLKYFMIQFSSWSLRSCSHNRFALPIYIRQNRKYELCIFHFLLALRTWVGLGSNNRD